MGADSDPHASRPPTPDDLKRLCVALNSAGAKYLIIGGFAVNYYGLTRATEDVDLLIDPAPDNLRRVQEALCILPDRAAKDLTATDLAQYSVIRIVDEITVDLLTRVGEVTFSSAEAVPVRLDDVTIPIASLPTLIATKQGLRERDQLDRAYLLRVQSDLQSD